jgi:hypothetical protein
VTSAESVPLAVTFAAIGPRSTLTVRYRGASSRRSPGARSTRRSTSAKRALIHAMWNSFFERADARGATGLGGCAERAGAGELGPASDAGPFEGVTGSTARQGARPTPAARGRHCSRWLEPRSTLRAGRACSCRRSANRAFVGSASHPSALERVAAFLAHGVLDAGP